MRVTDLLSTAIANLGRHKLRTSLTVAGVAIGTTALALMVSLAAGVQIFAVEQTQAMMANDLVYVTNYADVGNIRISLGQIGGPAEEVKEDKGTTEQVKPISAQQVSKLRALPHVTAVYPSIYVRADSIKLVGNSKAYEASVEPAYPGSRTVQLVAGPGFSGNPREAILSNQYLTVFGWATPAEAIGQTVALTLSRPADDVSATSLRLGEPMETQKKQFSAKVVGLTVKTAAGKSALVPFPYALEMARWQARDYTQFSPQHFGYNGILQVEAPEHVDQVAQAVRAMGMGALTPADQLGMINTLFVYLEGILSVVGLVALAVASLGIVNTLVMAIYERTREIGVWMALGATRSSIRALFAAEAAAIGFAGGATGLSVAWLVGQGINAFARATFARDFASFALSAFPPWLVVSVLGFSTMIGLAAGLLPANRAARLDPVEALRHE